MTTWANISRTVGSTYFRYLHRLRCRFGAAVFCSKCFRDHGLSRTCEAIGRPLKDACSRCGVHGGIGVAAPLLDELIYKFFVRGTYRHDIGGYAPALQMSDKGNLNRINFCADTLVDWLSLKTASRYTLFHYGPALWRLGLTNHWEYDDSGEEIRHHLPRRGVELAMSACVAQSLDAGSLLHRIRLNVASEVIADPLQFDSPPSGVKRNFDRFDDADIPLFYAGRTVDVCLHEARLSNRDLVTVATFEIAQNLRVLDITGKGSKPAETPFDDAEVFFNGLVFSNQTHAECRLASRCIKEAGFDGFIYKSYHSPVMASPGENVALFGWPVKDGRLRIKSINNVFLEEIRTNYQLGPVFGPDEAVDCVEDIAT